jgi:hypothetical protein
MFTYTAEVFNVKCWSDRQFVIGEFSAASYSSGPSNYSTLGGISVQRFRVCRQTDF